MWEVHEVMDTSENVHREFTVSHNRFKRKRIFSSVPATISFCNVLCCRGQSLKRISKKLDLPVVWSVQNKIEMNVKGRWAGFSCCCFPPTGLAPWAGPGWGLSVQWTGQGVSWSCLAGNTAALRHWAAQHQQQESFSDVKEANQWLADAWVVACCADTLYTCLVSRSISYVLKKQGNRNTREKYLVVCYVCTMFAWRCKINIKLLVWERRNHHAQSLWKCSMAIPLLCFYSLNENFPEKAIWRELMHNEECRDSCIFSHNIFTIPMWYMNLW